MLLLMLAIATGLDGNWWLALDSRVWADKGAATLRLHQFEKYSGNPVLSADKPWEGQLAYLYGAVLPDEDSKGLRMWYHAHVDGKLKSKHGYSNLYATSKDGFHWQKPALGLYDFEGSKQNNIVLQRASGTGESHTPSVIYTPNDPDPARRYKMINYVYYDGYYGAYSADGIHWTDVAHQPVLEDPGDVGNFVWDWMRSRFIGYPKIFTEVRGFRRRSVGFSETTDFEKWPKARLILATDEEDDRGVVGETGRTEFYGLSAFPYRTLYVGLLWIYRLEKADERIWPELVVSADGVKWTRVPSPRQPVLPLGAPGTWDDGMIFTENQPLVRDDKLWLYYGGFDGPHNARNARAAIGLATLRRDGFASLNAGAQETVVETQTFTNVSGELTLNADALGGSLRVELVSGDGRVIDGYSRADCEVIRSNGTALKVKWAAHATLPAAPVRFRFVMKNASIYSFFAGDAASHSNTAAAISLE